MIDIASERLPRGPDGVLNTDQLMHEYAWRLEWRWVRSWRELKASGGTFILRKRHYTGMTPPEYVQAVTCLAILTAE